MKNLNQIFEEVLNEVTFNKDNTANNTFDLKKEKLRQQRGDVQLGVCEAKEIFRRLIKNFDQNNPFWLVFGKFEHALDRLEANLRVDFRENPDVDYTKIFSKEMDDLIFRDWGKEKSSIN